MNFWLCVSSWFDVCFFPVRDFNGDTDQTPEMQEERNNETSMAQTNFGWSVILTGQVQEKQDKYL